MSRGRLARRIPGVLLLAALTAGVSADEPLTAADIVRFLRAGISERIILSELRERGFAERLETAHEVALREAGASETLVVAVRRAAPEEAATPPAAAAPAPPRHEPAARPERPRGPTFGTTARSVRVPVSVLDKRGEPVLGLRGEDFELSEDGRRQRLTYFSGERRPLRIALALDVSGSMANKMGQVADALRHFIAVLEPADEVMVITFSADVHIDQDFTTDHDLLDRVFSRLQAAQGTALFDATIEAIRRVAPAAAESKAVVLVTDGVDTASRASFSDVRDIARRSEVPVFSIGIDSPGGLMNVFRTPGGVGPGRIPGPRRPGWPGGGGPRGWPGGGGGGVGRWPGGGGPMGERQFDARPLLDLADETGGRAEILQGLEHDHGRVDRLKRAVESIAVTLRHRYLVGYEPEQGKRGWRKIRVEVDRPSVKVQARKGYYTEG